MDGSRLAVRSPRASLLYPSGLANAIVQGQRARTWHLKDAGGTGATPNPLVQLLDGRNRTARFHQQQYSSAVHSATIRAYTILPIYLHHNLPCLVPSSQMPEPKSSSPPVMQPPSFDQSFDVFRYHASWCHLGTGNIGMGALTRTDQ